MKIINLTGHDIFVRPDRSATSIKITIPASNKKTRVDEVFTEKHSMIPTSPTIEIRGVCMPQVTDIPAPQPNTYYIVSRVAAMVLAGVHDRYHDILFPLLKSGESDGSVQMLGQYVTDDCNKAMTVEFVTEV